MAWTKEDCEGGRRRGRRKTAREVAGVVVMALDERKTLGLQWCSWLGVLKWAWSLAGGDGWRHRHCGVVSGWHDGGDVGASGRATEELRMALVASCTKKGKEREIG